MNDGVNPAEVISRLVNQAIDFRRLADVRGNGHATVLRARLVQRCQQGGLGPCGQRQRVATPRHLNGGRPANAFA